MTNPKDKEWYQDKEYLETFAGGIGSERHSRPNIPKIVAEAERRTWEEAKKVARRHSGVCCGCSSDLKCILEEIDTKLTELKKI